MDLAGNYQEPFAPTGTENALCICVCCGHQAHARHQIFHYPHRYIPERWSVNAHNRALRCDQCVDRDRTEPQFYRKQESWIDYGHGRSRLGDPTRPDRVTTVHPAARTAAFSNDICRAPPPEPATIQENSSMDEVEETAEAPAPGRKQRFVEQSKSAGQAIGDGLKMSFANQGGETLLDIANEMAGDVPLVKAALEHPEGREILKGFTAYLLDIGASQTDLVPEEVSAVCRDQLRASTLFLLTPKMGVLRKHLLRLAKIGREGIAEDGLPRPVKARIEDDDETRAKYDELLAETNSLRAELAELRADNNSDSGESKSRKFGRKGKKAS